MHLDDKVEMKAVIKGKVQGVGFRSRVCTYAKKYGLAGTVKNLEDGSVEIVSQGQKETLDFFLKELTNNPGAGIIEQILVEFFPKHSSLNGFTIIF